MKKEPEEKATPTPAEWLADNDRDLWANGVLVKRALKDCNATCNTSLSQSAFRRVRIEVCQWWRVEGSVRPFKGTDLDEIQWLALRNALEKHWVDLKDESVAFRVAYLRALGIAVNQALLKGSSTYSRLVKLSKEVTP